MDKVRCNKTDKCRFAKEDCPHFKEHSYKPECKITGMGYACEKGASCKSVESPLKKTFKAWAISDVIDGERQLYPKQIPDTTKLEDNTYDNRDEARDNINWFKGNGVLSKNARVEHVLITVESI